MTDRTAAADLRRQIEQTRHQLGATVEELAAKADVRGRTRARAADLMDRAGAMTVQLRSTASQAGYHVSQAGHHVQERAIRAGDTVHTVQDRAAHAGHAVEHRVPAPVRAPVRFAMRHPRPIVIVGAAGVALVAAGWLGRRRARR
ncbi:DUF3618 domain-containing protein [Streptomyces sp. NPDC051677]|uniref:DUF3618 domain-containing protein n=1 Tax=Streptomyces sp. NPDC051677 TaxID=3365669 RepID=UPI0037D7EEFF